MIYIENKKRKIENIQAQYPNADILDITSASTAHYAQILSPFYPHGGIPVPFTPGMYATCVEASSRSRLEIVSSSSSSASAAIPS